MFSLKSASAPSTARLVLAAAIQLLGSRGTSAFNAVRGQDGTKVSPPSGAKFHKMSKADAEWYVSKIFGNVFTCSPYGAIVISAAANGVDPKPVTEWVKKVLNVDKLGVANETHTPAEMVAGLRYALDLACIS